MPTVKELVEEAEENFGTGRHKNSSRLFKQAAVYCIEHDTVDGLYLMYRAIFDMQKSDASTLEIAKVLFQTVDLLLTQILRRTQEAIKSSDYDHLELLQLTQKVMKMKQMEEERETVIMAIRQEVSDRYNDEGDESVLFDFLNILPGDINILNKILFGILRKAPEELERGGFDIELVVAAKLIQAFTHLPKWIKLDPIIVDQLPEPTEDGEATLRKLVGWSLRLIGEIASGSYSDGHELYDDIVHLCNRYEQDMIIEYLQN